MQADGLKEYARCAEADDAWKYRETKKRRLVKRV